MNRKFETTYSFSGNSSYAMKELLYGGIDISSQHIAQEYSDGTWQVAGIYDKKKTIMADELETNKMLDYMVGIELGNHSPNRSLRSIIREKENQPNNIVHLYQQEIEAGRYEPTVIMTRLLRTPRTSDATVIVEMRDNDLLSQIKEDQMSEIDKINKIVDLRELVATKNHDNTWNLYAHAHKLSPLKNNVALEEATEMMAAIEEKRGLAKDPLPKNMVHHFSQVNSYADAFQVKAAEKPEAKIALQESIKEMNLKTQKIESQRGGTFNFNIN